MKKTPNFLLDLEERTGKGGCREQDVLGIRKEERQEAVVSTD